MCVHLRMSVHTPLWNKKKTKPLLKVANKLAPQKCYKKPVDIKKDGSNEGALYVTLRVLR